VPGQRSYRFGPFRLDAEGHLLFRDGHMLRLEPKVVDVLQLLVENAGGVVGKDTLLRTVWRDAVVGESSLTRTISLLRSTLGAGEGDQEYVVTIAKRGYRPDGFVRSRGLKALRRKRVLAFSDVLIPDIGVPRNE
jgi:DNA-binding winged helix-turn-helix (wHTH) protein